MQGILLKIRYFQRGLSKTFKKLNIFFPFWAQSLLMDEIIKNKRGLELVIVRLQVMKQVHKNFFISYILPDQVWRFNIKQFLSYSKNCTWKFMQTNSWQHKLFHFHLSFWIWKVWKGRGEITKTWISRKRKEFFRSNKKYFSQFLKVYHLVEK